MPVSVVRDSGRPKPQRDSDWPQVSTVSKASITHIHTQHRPPPSYGGRSCIQGWLSAPAKPSRSLVHLWELKLAVSIRHGIMRTLARTHEQLTNKPFSTKAYFSLISKRLADVSICRRERPKRRRGRQEPHGGQQPRVSMCLTIRCKGTPQLCLLQCQSPGHALDFCTTLA